MSEPTWFDTTARANFERWLLPLADRPLDCLQLGAFRGDASVWLLENLPQCGLADVDTWRGSEEHEGMDWSAIEAEYFERVYQWHVSGRLIVKDMTTDRFFETLNVHEPWAVGPRWDFIYIDADHTAPAVLADAVHAWPHLRPGGLLAFDDYAWRSERGPVHEPRMAIDAFTNCYSEQLDVLCTNAQRWVRRRA